MSNFFLNASPQTRETIKNEQMELHHVKNFCTAKNTISISKRHPTVWKNIFVNGMSNKELKSNIYKELTCLNTPKPNNRIKNGWKI